MQEMEIIAEGLSFPEGPIALSDGSVLVVEIRRATLTRCWGQGRTEIVSQIGGGPNGAAIGPDGAVYVCNNGGFRWVDRDGLCIPAGCHHDYSGGRIERIDPGTGRIDRLYDRCGDHPLRGPNDLVFDATGGFWFTDYGKDLPRQRDKSGIYYARPDGSFIREVEFGSSGYNGIGLSPDGKVLYAAETSTGRLWAFDVIGPGQIARAPGRFAGRLVLTMPGLQYFDSLAVTASGAVCVATLLDPGVTTVSTDGSWRLSPTPDPYTTNICFGGKDMTDAFVTLSGTGKLARMRWSEPGLRLHFNA